VDITPGTDENLPTLVLVEGDTLIVLKAGRPSDSFCPG